MFIVWRGWGILVPLFLVVGIVVTGLVRSLFGAAPIGPAQALLPLLTGLVAGGAIWFAAKALEARPDRIFIDKATGREIKVGANAGSFFFIPTRYWAFIALGLGALLAVTQLVNPHALATLAH